MSMSFVPCIRRLLYYRQTNILAETSLAPIEYEKHARVNSSHLFLLSLSAITMVNRHGSTPPAPSISLEHKHCLPSLHSCFSTSSLSLALLQTWSRRASWPSRPEVNEYVLVSLFQNRFPTCKSAKIMTDPISAMPCFGFGFLSSSSSLLLLLLLFLLFSPTASAFGLFFRPTASTSLRLHRAVVFVLAAL